MRARDVARAEVAAKNLEKAVESVVIYIEKFDKLIREKVDGNAALREERKISETALARLEQLNKDSGRETRMEISARQNIQEIDEEIEANLEEIKNIKDLRANVIELVSNGLTKLRTKSSHDVERKYRVRSGHSMIKILRSQLPKEFTTDDLRGEYFKDIPNSTIHNFLARCMKDGVISRKDRGRYINKVFKTEEIENGDDRETKAQSKNGKNSKAHVGGDKAGDLPIVY